MKVIIDIPEDVYEECQGHIYFPDTGGELFNAVENGTPLDDVKAEIISKHFHIVEKNDFDNGRTYVYEECISILDNIDKVESEDK